MPPDLEIVINAALDLPWLAQHPEMVFPQVSRPAAQWFKLIQHTAQERYYVKHRLDLIILGRRSARGAAWSIKGGSAGRNGPRYKIIWSSMYKSDIIPRTGKLTRDRQSRHRFCLLH